MVTSLRKPDPAKDRWEPRRRQTPAFPSRNNRLNTFATNTSTTCSATGRNRPRLPLLAPLKPLKRPPASSPITNPALKAPERRINQRRRLSAKNSCFKNENRMYTRWSPPLYVYEMVHLDTRHLLT